MRHCRRQLALAVLPPTPRHASGAMASSRHGRQQPGDHRRGRGRGGGARRRDKSGTSLAMLAHAAQPGMAPDQTPPRSWRARCRRICRCCRSRGCCGGSGAQLSRLVDDPLDRVANHAGRDRPILRTIQRRVIAQALETVEPLMREKSRHAAQPDAGDSLVVDVIRAMVALSNVGERRQVHRPWRQVRVLGARRRRREAVNTVADDGIGIAERCCRG